MIQWDINGIYPPISVIPCVIPKSVDRCGQHPQHPNGGSLTGQARLITPSVVSERLKVNGSVARQAIRHLEEPVRLKSDVTMVTVGPVMSCKRCIIDVKG